MIALICNLKCSSVMSASSPSPAMPGAYRFPDLTINTHRISNLSTFSTDTVFFSPTETEQEGTDLDREFDVLEKLRQDVHQRLALRPLAGLSDSAADSAHSATGRKRRSLELDTPVSATSSIFSYTTAPSSPAVGVYSPTVPSHATLSHTLGRLSAHPTSSPYHPTFTASLPDILNPPAPVPIYTTASTSPEALAILYASPKLVPLIVDTRPQHQFDKLRLPHSTNIAIPTLILKRCRKPGGGFPSLDSLRTYLTSDISRQAWDMLMNPAVSSPVRWNGTSPELSSQIHLSVFTDSL